MRNLYKLLAIGLALSILYKDVSGNPILDMLARIKQSAVNTWDDTTTAKYRTTTWDYWTTTWETYQTSTRFETTTPYYTTTSRPENECPDGWIHDELQGCFYFNTNPNKVII